MKSSPKSFMTILEPENTSARAVHRGKIKESVLLGFNRTFLTKISKVIKRPFFVLRNIARIDRINFLNRRLLPHLAILLVLCLVALTNIDQAEKAKAIENELISLDPADEEAIVDYIDQFTVLLPNDKQMVESADSDLGSSGGFVGNNASVQTIITPRVEPDPDNTSETVYYVVKNGDTLSGLGMKFSVKVATLKYLNDLKSADNIKPNQKLRIPAKGYEVSATLIAKKESLERSKIASNNLVSTKNQTVAKKTYAGVVKGVKYVERSYGECYTWVTSQGYAVGGHLLAKWIPTNSKNPKAGGLVVTYESWAGHVAIVTSVNGDGTFNLRERNYTSGWITERTMSVDNSKIKGFVN